MIKKLVVMTGYSCNNNCMFCYDENKRKFYRDKSLDQIKQDLLEGRKHGCSYVDLMGGEITIRKDVIEIVKFAKDIGYDRIAITTNGRMLAYKDFCKRLVDAGLTSVIFSIHGHNAELHDYQTRVKGSFIQLLKGLHNMQELAKSKPVFIGTNTTITRLNYRYLPKIGEFLVKNKIKNSEFIFVDPTGAAYNQFENIVPAISEIATYVKKLLDIGIKHNIPHWCIRYYPLCYLKGYENNISEINTPFSAELHFGPEFTNFDVDSSRRNISRVKSKNCQRCIYCSICEGVWKEYANRRGLSGLKPVK